MPRNLFGPDITVKEPVAPLRGDFMHRTNAAVMTAPMQEDMVRRAGHMTTDSTVAQDELDSQQAHRQPEGVGLSRMPVFDTSFLPPSQIGHMVTYMAKLHALGAQQIRFERLERHYDGFGSAFMVYTEVHKDFPVPNPPPDFLHHTRPEDGKVRVGFTAVCASFELALKQLHAAVQFYVAGIGLAEKT